jgi:uncharacterized protein HemY
MTLLIKTNLLIVQNAKGNYQAVREQFFQLFKDKKEATPDLLEQLYQADSKRLYVLSGKEQIDLATDLLETIELLNKKKPDPFLLYRSGQISMVVGNNAAATDFFRRAYSAAPPDAHYRRAARTYIQKLERLK